MSRGSSLSLILAVIATIIALVAADVCLIVYQQCDATGGDPQCSAPKDVTKSLRIYSSDRYNETHCGGYECGVPTTIDVSGGTGRQFATLWPQMFCLHYDNATIGQKWCANVQSEGCEESYPCEAKNELITIFRPRDGYCGGQLCGMYTANQMTACNITTLIPL